MNPFRSFEALSLPVLIYGITGDVVFYNSALQEALVARPSQLENVLCSDHSLLMSADVQRAVRQTLQTKETQQNIQFRVDCLELKRPGSPARILDLVIEPFDLQDVPESMWILHAHDGTAREAIRKQEHLQDNNQEHQILVRGLMHEINNPLGGIRGSAEILMDGGLDESERTEFAEGIVRDVDRIRSIMDVFRQTALTPKPKLDWFNLSQSIFEVVHNIRMGTEREIDWRLTVDVALPQICSDSTGLSQVLTNLLLNAVAFTGSDGIVSLKVRTVYRPKLAREAQVLLGKDAPNPEEPCRLVWISVTIEDSGIGVIGLENKLFAPFYTTRPGGTGLGLALSQNIVQQLGGSIQAGASKLGGARFEFEIPTWIRA